MAKKITVRTHGPLSVSQTQVVPWEDVYITWTGKPGRTTYFAYPCLCGKSSAEIDQQINFEVQTEHPEFDLSEDIDELQKALDSINNGEIYVVDHANKITEIFTPKQMIDRREAEKMISTLMKHYGFDDIKCKWKRTKYFIQAI